MCLPSSLDPTLAPPGCHVASLFTQYTPYTIYGHTDRGHWTDTARNEYTNLGRYYIISIHYIIFVVLVFDSIEEYAPGFRQLIVGWETLTPPDLERVFGLTGGVCYNIDYKIISYYFNRIYFMAQCHLISYMYQDLLIKIPRTCHQLMGCFSAVVELIQVSKQD